MQLDRRSLLAGCATLAGSALAGCGGGSGGERVPEPQVNGGEGTIGSQDLGSQERHAVLQPPEGLVTDWEAAAAGGQTRFRIDLRNIDPAAIEGTLIAKLTHREEGNKQYETTFSVDGGATTTIEMTIPVTYEEYTTNMSAPAFEATDLQER